jgi:hypothetical protein
MTIPINLRVHPYYQGTKILDGNTYQLSIHWNINTEKWYLDIQGITNSIRIKSIALLAGKELLGQHGQRELGQLNIVDGSGANQDPDYDGIGGRWTLEYTPLT